MGIMRISTSKELRDEYYEVVHFYIYSEGDLGSSHVILRVNVLSRYHVSIISFKAAKTRWMDVTAYPSIVDEETEAQAGYVTCLRSYRK